jgi:hypothetical protein
MKDNITGHKEKNGFQSNLFEENSKDTEVWFKAKITKHGKKNVRDEMGNALLKHVFTSLWLRSKRPPGSAYVLIIADFVFIIKSCLLPIHFVKSFFLNWTKSSLLYTCRVQWFFLASYIFYCAVFGKSVHFIVLYEHSITVQHFNKHIGGSRGPFKPKS